MKDTFKEFFQDSKTSRFFDCFKNFPGLKAEKFQVLSRAFKELWNLWSHNPYWLGCGFNYHWYYL